MADHLSGCWARAAEKGPARRRADRLEQARQWDHWNHDYRRVAALVADELYQEGLDARERQDWPAAFDAVSDTLRIEPWRAWARRYAEEARDHRLGLTPGEDE